MTEESINKAIRLIESNRAKPYEQVIPNERRYSSTQVIALLKMILEDKEF